VELASDRFSLEDVAAGAGTTVQTVLPHFGSKDQLLRATMSRGMDRVRDERMQAPVGDVPGAVRNLVALYEDRGDTTYTYGSCCAATCTFPALRARRRSSS
jgi:AcrR family transcriptional regulator